jgi:hypothetical protein
MDINDKDMVNIGFKQFMQDNVEIVSALPPNVKQ